MTSGCAALRQEIESYVDGDLDTVSCEAVERHCVSCPSCRDLVADLRRVVGLCRDAGRSPVPAAVRAHAREQVKRLLSSSRIPTEP